jgi:electron transfer flavoprotein beta subunit
MGARKKEIRKYAIADLGLGPDDVGERGAREKVLTVGRPPVRPPGKIVKDDGDGGKQIADFLADLKLV